MTEQSLDQAAASLRRRLPLLERTLAFNHAGIAPQPLCDEVAHFESLRASVPPSDALATLSGLRPRIRELYAHALSAAPEEIAVMKNTAEGVNFVAQGFPWKTGDELLSVDIEYPSNVYPWWNLKSRGVVTRTVPERNGRVDLGELEAAITPRTRMLAVSHVEFASGFRFRIPDLVALARRHDLFLFLDIAQSIGALPVDLTGVDAAAWANWKWLMGPIGMGGFYLSRRHLETIRPTFVGSDGMIPKGDYLEYDFRFREDASRFEYSTENVLGLLGVKASLEFFAPLLAPPVAPAFERRLMGNCSRVIEIMEDAGGRLYSSRRDEERSGILSFEIPSGAEEMRKRLKSRGIEVAVRAGRLRISPHFYNTAEHLDRLLLAVAP